MLPPALLLQLLAQRPRQRFPASSGSCPTWGHGCNSIADTDTMPTPCPLPFPEPVALGSHLILLFLNIAAVGTVCHHTPTPPPEHRTLMGSLRGRLGLQRATVAWGPPSRGGLVRPSPYKASSLPLPFLKEIVQILGGLTPGRTAGIAFSHVSEHFGSHWCFGVGC